jgi:methyl-accepting chemotaxis protein
MVEYTAFVDLLAVLAYAGAVVIGYLNYRDTDAESGFWANFTFASVLGTLWVGVVTAEHFGLGGAVLDIASVSLLTATVAVFAVGATGTLAVVEDMKRARAEVERSRRDAEASRREAESMSRSLEETASEFGARMERAATGDLTVRLTETGGNEAMASVADSFNRMIADLERTLVHIQSFGTDVSASTQEINASVSEVSSASEQVSEAMSDVAADTERQHDRLRDVTDEMSTLSATIEEIASTSTEVATTSTDAADRGNDGRDSARTALEEMVSIREQTDDTVEEVEALNGEINEIGEIVGLITEIAERTNLLALNASIEAAGAGEAGEGFAVVADEIKTLAGEAGEATARIEGLISDIRASADDTVEDIRDVGVRVAGGTETVEEALSALDDIVDGIEDVNRGVQEIDRATTEQASSTEGVLSMVDDAAASSDRTTDEVASVSAAAEQQTASLTEVSTSVDDLTHVTENLSQLLDDFRVDFDADTPEQPSSVGGTRSTGRTAPVSADGGVERPPANVGRR